MSNQEGLKWVAMVLPDGLQAIIVNGLERFIQQF